MNAYEIIREIQDNASEWLETVEEPRDLLVVILANKLASAKNHIEYLEKRLGHVNSRY